MDGASTSASYHRRRTAMDLIPVRPKHYRAIVLEVLAIFPDARVFLDRWECADLSERGPVTQRGIARLIDFEMRVGRSAILGFHDHPDEMWIDGDFQSLAERLQALGHLKIESLGQRTGRV
jgi:hypothetical protein